MIFVIESGYSAEDAQRISMEAVEEAEKRVEEKRDGEIEKRKSGDIEKKVIMEKREEKEQKLFDMAYDLAQWVYSFIYSFISQKFRNIRRFNAGNIYLEILKKIYLVIYIIITFDFRKMLYGDDAPEQKLAALASKYELFFIFSFVFPNNFYKKNKAFEIRSMAMLIIV